jgi:hypothetical protein
MPHNITHTFLPHRPAVAPRGIALPQLALSLMNIATLLCRLDAAGGEPDRRQPFPVRVQ